MVSLKQKKDVHVFDFLLFFLGVLIKAKGPNIIIDLKIIHFDNLKDISSLNLFFFFFFWHLVRYLLRLNLFIVDFGKSNIDRCQVAT